MPANGDIGIFAKRFKITESEWIGRSSFVPCFGVDFVSGATSAQKVIEAVEPKAVVYETDGCSFSDAECLAQCFSGILELFHGAGENHPVE